MYPCGEEVVEGAGGGSAEGVGGDGVEGCGGAVGVFVDYGFDGFEAGKGGVGCFFFFFSEDVVSNAAVANSSNRGRNRRDMC